jgi:choline dehydrogenase
VGANYQEETTHFATFSGNLEPVSGAYTGYVTASQVFGDEAAQVETKTRNQIQTWAQKIVESSKPSSLTIANVKSLLLVQHDLIFRQQVPIGEILTVSAPGGVVASSYWVLHPFSRGSVHLSPNAMDSPLIDPAFFHIDFDMDVTVALGRFMQKFWRTTPINEFIRAQLDPTPEVLPLNATYEQWASWSRAFGESYGEALRHLD